MFEALADQLEPWVFFCLKGLEKRRLAADFEPWVLYLRYGNFTLKVSEKRLF